MLISPWALRSVLRTLDLRGGVLLAESLLNLGWQGVWAEESPSIHLTIDFFILNRHCTASGVLGTVLNPEDGTLSKP